MANITLNKAYIKSLLEYVRQNPSDEVEKEKQKITRENISNEEANEEVVAKAVVKALAGIITDNCSKAQEFTNKSGKKGRLAKTFTSKRPVVKTETLEWIADGLAKYNQTLKEDPRLPKCDKDTNAETIQEYLTKTDKSTNYEILTAQNKDLSENRAKYLFEEVVGRGVTPKDLLSLQSDWPGFPFQEADNEIQHELKALADQIINKSLEHPLYRYLYSNMKKNGAEARVLLQHSVRFRAHVAGGYEVDVRPPVGATIEWIHSTLRETVCPKRAYTETDFLIVAGYLAERASEGNHAVSDLTDAEVKELATNSGLSADEVRNIKDDILSSEEKAETVRWTIVQNGNVRKFKIRLYRIIFSALSLAREKNFSPVKKPGDADDKSKNADDRVDALYNAILSKIPKTDENDDHVNIENQFDDIVMYAAALILSLNADLADALISKICENANDYRVEHRDKQIALIYILSYLLCENVPMTSKQRAEVFKVSYSRSIYKLQQMEIYRIFDTSYFYKEEIQQSLKNACTFNEEKTKTIGQPEYIFLYHTVDPEDAREETETGRQFLKNACAYRSASWHDERAKAENRTISSDDIKNALNALKNPESKENAMYYAYGMQMLGYAYANETAKNVNNTDPKTPLITAVSENNKDIFLSALILADYYCRLYHPFYSEKNANNPALFLSCGAFRAICTGQFRGDITLGKTVFDKSHDDSGKKKAATRKTESNSNSEKPETETQKICNRYMSWFKSEKGRYQFLLGRLLLYLPSECIDQNEIYIVLRETLNTSEPKFLKYDEIHPETLKSQFYNSDKKKFLGALK